MVSGVAQEVAEPLLEGTAVSAKSTLAKFGI
jgi:hypothetical protein